jgi:hypothetical protein
VSIRRVVRRSTTIPVLFLLALFPACSDDDTADDAAGGTAGSGSAPAYEDVASLAADLDGVADGCALEYEGLEEEGRQVSICTLGGEVAELSVWEDRQALDDLAAAAEDSGDPVVVGSNWSVDVSDPALASQVAEATGGAVRP